jgi:capsular polysaccharide biosynthesis protein
MKDNIALNNARSAFINEQKIDLSNTDIELKKKTKIINDIVFIICYSWSWNYHVNYIETLPNILFYLKLLNDIPNLKLFIPGNFLNMYKEIFNILNLNINLIIPNENTFFEKAYYSNFGAKYFSNDLSKYNLEINNIIKNYFINTINKNIICNDNKICIGRKNNLAGKFRYIINENELINYCGINNINYVYLEDLSLSDKYSVLSNFKYIITPVGASIVNLFFTFLKNTKKIILLCPNYDYSQYLDIMKTQLLFFTELTIENIDVLLCEAKIDMGVDIGDQVNKPYIVDINKLDNILKS